MRRLYLNLDDHLIGFQSVFTDHGMMIPDELPASLSGDRFSVSLGEGDAKLDDTGRERRWKWDSDCGL